MRKSLFIAALATAACTEATPPRAAVAAVTVTPSSATIAVGGTQQLSAKAFDAAGTELTDRSITWTAVPGSVATVSGSGLVTAIGAGVVTVTATSEGKAGTASVTISVPVASIIITPATAVVGTGASRQLGATVRDSTGAALSGRTVSWSSSNSAVASVDATSGLVTAISTGTAIISAGAEGKTGSAMIYVSVPVATVIAPSTASLVVGGSYQLTAEARNASGEVMPERSVTWSSSNAALASVNGSGLVTGVSPGSVTVTATSEGKSAQVAVTVRAANAASAQIVAGENHTCALTVGGDAYCWGHSLAAGNGATTPSGFVFLPTLVVGGHKWSALSAARFYTFGITTDGDLYVWGRNYPGAGLGTPNFAVMTTPQKVSELKFKAIAAGSGDHSCGLTTTGAAYCWGANQYGQLGNGTTTTSHASVAVAGGLTFEKIAVAGYHSVALTAAGKAFVWGGGYAGDGAAAQRNSPVEVSGGHAFTAVSSGHAHTLGLKADGSIWVWGSTGWGALGLGGQSYYAAAPTKLATPVDFKAVLAGWQDFSVALSTTGVAYTWGKRVGTAPLDDEYDPTPIQVAGTQPFATAAGGMGHVMFLGANGDSYGWGYEVTGAAMGNYLTNNPQPSPSASPSFTLEVPASITVTAGQSATATVKLIPSNGGFTTTGPKPFTSTVSLASSAPPAGVSIALSPASLNPSQTSARLVVSAATGVSSTTSVSVNATAPGLTSQTANTWAVVKPPAAPEGSMSLFCTPGSNQTPANFPDGFHCLGYDRVGFAAPAQYKGRAGLEHLHGVWVDATAGVCMDWKSDGQGRARYKGGIGGGPVITPWGRWGILIRSTGVPEGTATQWSIVTETADEQTVILGYDSDKKAFWGWNFKKEACPW